VPAEPAKFPCLQQKLRHFRYMPRVHGQRSQRNEASLPLARRGELTNCPLYLCMCNVKCSLYVVCCVLLPEHDYVTFGSLLSQIHLSSVVCLWSVTFVCPTQVQYFFAILYLSHPFTSVQNFTEIIPGEPLHRGVKRKRGSKIERCHI